MAKVLPNVLLLRFASYKRERDYLSSFIGRFIADAPITLDKATGKECASRCSLSHIA